MFKGFARKRLETKRSETLLDIRKQRHGFEEMLQRAEVAGETVDGAFISKVRERFAAIEEQASRKEVTGDELDSLYTEAEYQGQLEAYICPRREIADEG